MTDSTRAPAAEPSDRTPKRVDTEELLSLLGDEYTMRILSALGEKSLPAREIADRAGVSRPTVYRRLDRLEGAGVVETASTVSPGGQHRREFRVVLDEVTVALAENSNDASRETEAIAHP
jgi:DNA-binding transcriptional ArsR family regulator